MNRHKSNVALVLVIVLAYALPHANADQPGAIGPDPKTVSVLYAGKPDSDRMAESKAFLEKHFKKVATCDLEGELHYVALQYDVVVIDWPTVLPRTSDGKVDMSGESPTLKLPKVRLSEHKPVIMMGTAAAAVARNSSLAIDWRCLCLENYAHDFNVNHPIFRGPVPVNIPIESIEKPFDYILYPGTSKLGEHMQAWKVQELTYPDLDPGLVSSPGRFKNTLGTEVISCGINGKGPTSVAIGRHANFLLWGFSGAVNEMTESAQSVFVNSICYIKNFVSVNRSQVVEQSSQRDDFLISIYHLRQASDAYLAKYSQHMKHEMETTQFSPELLEQFGSDPAETLRKTVAAQSATTLEKIPDAVRATTGDDIERIIAYYSENLEYLHKGDDGKYIVDEDVKKLGVSNRKQELLKRCVEMLKSGQDAELARALLARYVTPNGRTPIDWQAWYQKEGWYFEFDEDRCKFVVPSLLW